MVGSPLRPCQINEGYLAVVFSSVLQHDLQHCMRPRTITIGAILGSNSDCSPELDSLHQSFHAIDLLLLQSNDVHILPSILASEQEGPVIEQIVQLPAVDFVETDPTAEVFVLSPSQLFENVVGRQQVQPWNMLLRGS